MEPTLTEDDWYDALVRRDVRLRDAFVVGVKTTGIYCRAGCPARTPRRENLEFLPTSQAAQDRGYRACLRCCPDDKARPGAEAVEAACRLIESSDTVPTLLQLARAVDLSPHHFHRLFKARTGVTPAAYAVQVRDGRAKLALSNGSSVTRTVYDSGFGAPSRFYDSADKRFGMTPSAWRKAGKGERLRVTVVPCSLGQVLVAMTDKGISSIELGDEAEAMLDRFRRRFAQAEVTTDDADLNQRVGRVIELIDDPRGPGLDLPLDIRGTAFQQRVWQALRSIPAGETRTYGELAAAIGKPGAARAVGAACGANPICVVVPCHRVVGTNGSLTGYAWGTGRKKELLRREGA
ncbi:MAG: bifunctional DNA-binding transcriptional regulator/O6-methylguanine-DNA methyltransferase Ada [Caulobacterales bacterium]|nr:bifunctional DNA-binding transcriptional regulator/O6-methylguanine-DNA methyltransferase Ada [Caulobacterales bacterium]